MTEAQILDVVRAELAHVLAVDDVDPDATFAGDLHADSLDLVETVERVERRLASAGHPVRLGEAELLALTSRERPRVRWPRGDP